MKTTELSNRAEENKTAKYIDLATNFFNEAREIFINNKSFILKMACDHAFEHFEKAKNADCEYTAYINTFGCETILNKMKNYLITKRYE